MQVSSLISLLKTKSGLFSPIVSFSPGTDRLIQLDFTGANKELSPDVLEDTKLFSDYINRSLDRAGARYGIGGYGEHRTVYSRSPIFDAAEIAHHSANPAPPLEPRRLHLGTDIWGKPHTAVMTPIDGIVHSFAFNGAFGDYGATIILTHQLDGITFYTLYGHLSLSSIKNLQGGELVCKGEIFAEFGIPDENGQWPPHLHFQIIEDLQGWEGDYPGVCKYSEKEAWLSNCPDPDLILQMNRFLER